MISKDRAATIATLAAALIAWLMPAVATAQTAEDLVQKFDSICLAARGDRGVALQAMEAAGWMVAPQHVIDQLGAGLTNVEARLYSARNVVYIGMVGDAPLDEPTPTCSIGMAPGANDLAASLKSWSGAEPLITGETGDVGFFFSESQGVRTAITDRNEAQRLSQAGDILMVSARTTPQLSHIVSMRQRNLIW
jgi:hypothetical protein